MKKLLKGALTLAIATIVGIPQLQAATNDYTIEVKSKKYSKQTTKGFYGINYTENDASYTDQYWPLVDGYLPYYQSNGSYNIPMYQMVRQFGVSMGVVYWINPAENYIYWWNTVTGENGRTRPTKSYGVGYQDGINNPNFDFEFLGAETGSGAMSHDWYGNLVHMWNDGMNGWGTTAGTHFVQGYAVYKSATEYGKLMDFTPKLSKMNDTGRQNYPFYQRKVTGDAPGTLVGGANLTDDLDIANIESYFTKYNPDSKTPNPNYPADKVVWSTNYDYHKANTSIAKQPTDFLGVSGNLWGKGLLQGATVNNVALSAYTSGWSTGQVFHARNDVVYGNMFADGQYTNWYLNYRLTATNPINSSYGVNAFWTNFINDAGTTVSGKYTPKSEALKNYGTEYLFRETDVLEYFWSVPQGGLAEYDITDRGGYEWLGYVYGLYTNEVDFYSYCSWTQSRPSDAMSAPEVDSIKGSRVMIHNKWLQFAPGENEGNYDKRDGSILIRTSKYTGGMSTSSSPVFTGNPTNTYSLVGLGYGYNKTPNIPEKFINTGVNCWSELERVNDNVLALYTHVPGQGFSKTFITAVKPNNAVSSLIVAQSWNANGDPVHTLTWTPQADDRATMHTYEVWYRKKKGSTYEDKKTIDGASRDVWNFAGKAHVKYNGATDSTTTSSGNRSGIMPNKAFYNSYTAESCKFEFVAPRGDNGDGTKYERTYEYMVIPVYDASSHRGTEATTSIVTAPAPSKIYGNLYQVTEKNANGETLYGFSIRLDPYFLPGAQGSTEAKRLIITSAGGEEGSDKLEDAMSVTLADGTPLTPLDGITFQTKTDGTTITHGAYALSIDITGKVGADGKLPSIIWHNVNPNLEFQLAAHIESTSDVQYSGTGNLSTTLIVPGASTNMTAAQVQPLDGDYRSMQGDEDLPLGAKLKTGSDEVTNKVTLTSANTFGTKMSIINPLYVTDEVLQNWNIQYTYHILKNDVEVVDPIKLAASNEEGGAEIYSNSATVVADVLGLPILKTDWDTHTVLKLNDAEKATNDNLVKQNYNSATANDVYKTKVNVSYTRKTNAVTASKTDGPTSTITMPTESPFNALAVDWGACIGALFQRTSSHFDMDAPESNGHYYPYFYDAGVQFSWGTYADNLNKYIGFHAVSGIDCVGHYENASSTTWTQYYAGTVLSDTYVAEYNKTLENSGVTPFMAAIGYDGTNGSDWSALASEKRMLPMNIHYVWGGDTWVAPNDEEGIKAIQMSALVSADYPVIEGITLKVNQYVDGKNYSMISETATFAEPTVTMNVISIPSSLDHFYVEHATTVTGVEGIITNACGGWQLYPNPVGSEFTLQAPMTIGNVQIFTMDGQLVKVVKDVKDTTVKINVDELPQGVYIVNTLGVAKMMIKM